MDYSRRDFLKGAAAAGTVAAAGMALAGCSTSSESEVATDSATSQYTWDYEKDLVIVGLGAAGTSCAVHATKEDPTVSILILEKQPEDDHHPSTQMSGGSVMYVRDAAKAAEYMKICAGPSAPVAATEAWAQEAAKIRDYVANDLGFEGEFFEQHAMGEHKTFPDADQVGTFMLTPQLGAYDLWDLMVEAVQKDNIEILYETPGYKLLTREQEEGKKEIIGVEAKQGETSIFIKANKGVLLSCGGFEFNDKLKNFLPAPNISFYNHPAYTGDGVIMAQEVGAQLWRMNKMLGRGIGVYDDIGMNFIIQIAPAPYLMLDKYGKRFVNEELQAQLNHAVYYSLIQYDAVKGEYPRIPCWWIMDESRLGTPLTISNIGMVGVGYYEWSSDNSKEIEAGWLVKCETLEDVAAATEIDIAALTETMASYDAACDSGVDEFGRSAETLVKFTPPYYVSKLWPGGPATSGGPERNEFAQVIDVRGEPIPRLYSAGELGQVVGDLYPGAGGDISEAISFGAIAARNIVASEAWGE